MTMDLFFFDSREIKKKHSQYYTANELGDDIIKLIPFDGNVRSILDLSAGEGALLLAASKVYKTAKLVAFDIDPNNVKKLSNINNCISYNRDATLEESINLAAKNFIKYDIVVGNPPFKSIDKTTYSDCVFKRYGLYSQKDKIRAEVLFLLVSLDLLRKGGIAAFILPDGFFTNVSFSELRKNITDNYNILSVVEVPSKSFVGTEARTHIIIIKKECPGDRILLKSLNDQGVEIYISRNNFVGRGDFKYHSLPVPINTIPLGELDVEIIRGSKSVFNRYPSLLSIHTNSFGCKPQFFKENTLITQNVNMKVARKNDIVIPRVGTRVIGKYGVIKDGYFRVSECIIIIRTSCENIFDMILSSLESDFGQKWLITAAKGVGAQHITIDIMKEFPVFMEKA
ncbi:N-6 DNA methylase [Erwinia sp. 198]|uniref:N-6 DNA methylase n=1 Tax=Erwinia sp. 198 TaxID=2022746 RepID=UPI000F6615DA|nr:N-6 DNA methylase [Erwinia sp. 198]